MAKAFQNGNRFRFKEDEENRVFTFRALDADESGMFVYFDDDDGKTWSREIQSLDDLIHAK